MIFLNKILIFLSKLHGRSFRPDFMGRKEREMFSEHYFLALPVNALVKLYKKDMTLYYVEKNKTT